MIYLGTSGFSYDDWENRFYPPGTPKSKMFDCYCRWFNSVEINSTFYHIPTPTMMRSLVRRADGRIRFSVKMSERVTHKGELGPDVVAQFRRSIEPVIDANALGAALFQFPFRFHHTLENRDYLLRALDAFKSLPAVVEIRHDSWQSPTACRFFWDRGISLCITDMPKLRGLPVTTTDLTGRIAYIRFHGRNGKHWFQDAYPGAPYDYNYTDGQLKDWVEPIKRMERKAETTLVFFNNHVHGQASQNALTFQAMMEGRRAASGPSNLFDSLIRI